MERTVEEMRETYPSSDNTTTNTTTFDMKDPYPSMSEREDNYARATFEENIPQLRNAADAIFGSEGDETEPPMCPVCETVNTGGECPGCGYEDEKELPARPCLTGMRIAGLVSSGPVCSYVRQRGTEAECVDELWQVRQKRVLGSWVIGEGAPFVSCTLHLVPLLTDRFVTEYSLTRVRQ